MKAMRWFGGILVVAVVTILTQNFFLHQDTAQKADVAARQATAAAAGQTVVIHKLDQLKPGG